MTFPTTSVLDDFNRANAKPPSANWSKIYWAVDNVSLVSNQIVGAAASETDASYWNVETFGADCEAYATIASRATSGDYANMTLEVRIQDPAASTYDGYELEVVMREGGSNVNILRIWKYVDNDYEQLGSDIATTVNNGDAFGIEVTGTSTTTIRAYRKPSGGSWGQVGSDITDSSSPITSAGYIGVGFYNNASAATSADDFGGGTVVAGGATVILDTATATASGISMDVVPGAMSIVLDPSALTMTGIPITISAPTGGITVVLETG